MKNILAGEMNWVEKVITFILRCANRAKKTLYTYGKTYDDVFMDITKIVNGLKVLYMRRWFLWETKKGNLYLPRIVRSDDEDYHSHPWPFNSLIISGGYYDMAAKVTQGLTRKHLVVTVEQTKPFHIYRRTATLVWAGTYDKKNEWGFTLDDGTFVPYRKYLNLPDDAPVAVYDRIDKQG